MLYAWSKKDYNSDQYKEWKKNHRSGCMANHKCFIGSMEAGCDIDIQKI